MSARQRKKTPARRFRWIALLLLVCGVVAVIVLRNRSSTDVPQLVAAKMSAPQIARVEAARQAVVKAPRSADAWGNYGMLLRAFDFNDEALECFRKAETLNARDPRWPYFVNRILQAADPPTAIAALKRAVELTGNTPPAPKYYLAKTLAEEGRAEEAQAHANVLVQAHPAFAPARLLLAQTAFARGDTNAAAQHVQGCLDDSRTRKAGWALLASLQQRAGNVQAAYESARESAAAPPDAAIEDPFASQIGAIRGDSKPNTERVHALLAARDFATASPLIDRLVKEHPDLAETWLLRGRFLLLQKDFRGAEAALRKHLELEPTSTQGFFQLGTVYLNSGNFPAAKEPFERAIALNRNFGPAWHNLGYALGRAGKWAEAAGPFREAIRLNPEHLDSYLLLADVELQLGNKAEAAKLVDTAFRINPIDPRIAALRRKL